MPGRRRFPRGGPLFAVQRGGEGDVGMQVEPNLEAAYSWRPHASWMPIQRYGLKYGAFRLRGGITEGFVYNQRHDVLYATAGWPAVIDPRAHTIRRQIDSEALAPGLKAHGVTALTLLPGGMVLLAG